MSEGTWADQPRDDPPRDYLPRADDEPTLVRPYTRTGGRTRASDADLALESLISVTDRGRATIDALPPDLRSICRLCAVPQSVMEIAALLRIPLGVARILVSDLASMHLVFVHANELAAGERPSVSFLERVLSGLQRL
jgi:Protein of unknown function (DUF742)